MFNALESLRASLSRPHARRRSWPNEGVVKTACSTAIAAERGSCQDRALDGDRGRTRELSSPRARRQSWPNEGVVKTARSTAIVVERGSCRDRALDGDRVLRLHQIIGSVELDPDATHDIWSQTLSLPIIFKMAIP